VVDPAAHDRFLPSRQHPDRALLMPTAIPSIAKILEEYRRYLRGLVAFGQA
jgi:hypothetical protein